jgi:hypothetical protein
MRTTLGLTLGIVGLVAGLPLIAGAQAVEVEPNNTLPQADAAPHFTGNVVIAGGISPVGDIDIFRLDLATAAVLHFESYDFGGMDCAAIATSLRLLNASGGVVAIDTAGKGTGQCAALTLGLAAGSYYLWIEETNSDALVAGYKLEIKRQNAAGSEVEPNDTPGEATAVVGSDIWVSGAMAVFGTPDFFAVTLPEGASIRAELIEGPQSPAPPCFSAFYSVRTLVLHDPDGAPLVTAFQNGRLNCPLIDGTGTLPADAEAHTLPAGTYFLAAHFDNFTGQGTDSTYRLVVRVLAPDLIFADNFEGAPMAEVVINEFNANISPGSDLVELRVVSGGNMAGFSLSQRNIALTTFSGLTVAANDFVVVHLDSNDPVCNPTSAPGETTSPSQFPSAAHPRNYDTAYDWYSADTGLVATDNVFTLYDRHGGIVDAVLSADNPTGTTAAASENQAAIVAAAGEWQRVGGGVPPGGFVDDDFRTHAVLDLNATGTTASGMSIQRTTNVDSNDKNGWTTGTGAPSTWGLLNAGQSP